MEHNLKAVSEALELLKKPFMPSFLKKTNEIEEVAERIVEKCRRKAVKEKKGEHRDGVSKDKDKEITIAAESFKEYEIASFS